MNNDQRLERMRFAGALAIPPRELLELSDFEFDAYRQGYLNANTPSPSDTNGGAE